MDFSQLNLLAVILATTLAFVLGGLWYSPILFGKKWQEYIGLSDADLQKRNPLHVFGLSFIFTLILNLNLALFLGNSNDLQWGVLAGFLAGFGFAGMSILINDQFENRKFSFTLINVGYHSIMYMISGAIITLMNP